MKTKNLFFTFLLFFFAVYCISAKSIPDLKTTKMEVAVPFGAGIPLSEYNALVDFYNNMNGANWTRNDNWLDTVNYTVNDWYGVWVVNGHVETIGFNNINVQGEIPASITDLTQLNKVSFNKCNIENKISDGIIQIQTLTNVFIRECNLTDSFNDIISNSHDSLQILNLELNNISGTIPDEIGSRFFTELWISGNNITGVLPSSIGNLSRLHVFYAGNNDISGTIPSEFGNIVGIQTVVLSNNKIEGPLPVELKNLTNLEDFVLDNNTIGSSNLIETPPYPKSGKLAIERQIPDDLSGLISLNQLNIDNNQLMFNDIEPIFSWSAYTNFEEFIYFPQDSIGTNKTYEKFSGDNITLSIDNYYPGNSDTYQWYRNGSILPSENSATLEINNLQESDAGNYYCKIRNTVATDLTLVTKKTNLSVTTIQGAGVPVAEYNALKDFYIALDGNNWNTKTNWLDTIYTEVNNWFGITVENEHVTKIDLPANNLAGELPEVITELLELETLKLDTNNISGSMQNWIDKLSNLKNLNLNKNQLSGEIHRDLGRIYGLRTLQLSNNQLSGEIPGNLINIKGLKEFHIDSNRYTSVHIEPIFGWGNFFNFESDFIYAPQYELGEKDSIGINFGEELNLSIKNYTPAPSDIFEWYKDSVLLPQETNAEISIAQVTSENTGTYFCTVSNSVATELVLNSKPVKITVVGDVAGAGISLAEYNTLVEIYNNCNGVAWTNSENWLDTTFHTVSDWFGITVENGAVSKFEMPDNNLSQIPEELKDLAELESINLSSGSFTGEIPNLGSLAKLTSLNLAENNFVFKNLTPITNWVNFTDFKSEFNYSPQPNIGTNKNITVGLGEEIDLTIDNYQEAPNDIFKWLKNGNSYRTTNSNSLTIEAEFDDNGATFLCEVSNNLLPDLKLTSALVSVEVLYSKKDSLLLNQLKAEYDTLQIIWADESMLDWPLINFQNGIVTAIDFSDLNLKGLVSSLFIEFDSLKWLNLSNNKLGGEFPNLGAGNNSYMKSNNSGNQVLKYLNISNNNFVFADLEPAADFLNAIDVFIYAPQPMVGMPFDTTIYKYENVTFEIGNYVPGEFDSYLWIKDGNVLDGNFALNCTIENALLPDSGIYYCSITNSKFPDLTLTSETFGLKVLIPVYVNEFFKTDINVYPNPAETRIFIDIKNETINLKMYNLTGKLIFEKNNFQSDWLDIKSYTKGVYILKLTDNNSKTINKKVIFR